MGLRFVSLSTMKRVEKILPQLEIPLHVLNLHREKELRFMF
jgi:hypothetical protein